MPSKLKVAFIGVNHWHSKHYIGPALAADDVDVVGIHDADPAVAKAKGQEIGCEYSTDFRDLLSSTKPDFVFAFGRHIDMHEEATYLIEEGYPTAMEKPCGLTASDVAALRDLADKRGAFFAVPYVYRQSDMWRNMQQTLDGERLDYMTAHYLSGPASRYAEIGNGWVVDNAQSGGGSTINLSSHFIDLALQILGPDATVETATRSNAIYGGDTEDFSLLVLSDGKRRAAIQTGYLQPPPVPANPLRNLDLHLTFTSKSHFFAATDSETFESVTLDGSRTIDKVATVNNPYYPRFVADVLDRFRTGTAPIAGLADAAKVLRIVERAYEVAPLR